MNHDLSFYLALNYPLELVREDGVYVAYHPDLPGCVSQGDSPDEAVANLDDAREAWLRSRCEDGLPIEEPIDENDCSGRVSLRMTPYLHAELARLSRKGGVSLNQLLNNILSEYVGGRRSEDHVMGLISEEMRALATIVGDLRGVPSTAKTWSLKRRSNSSRKRVPA